MSKQTVARFETGSRAYGTALPTSDHDKLVVEFASAETLLGNSRQQPKQVFEGVEDSTVLTLNHVFSQALKGAPNTLELLWMKPVTTSWAWEQVQAVRGEFLHKDTLKSWFGMAERNKQMADRDPNQEAKAWKMRMHSLRVLQQAAELVFTGSMTFPRPNAQELMDVRNGLFTLDAYEDMYAQALRDTRNAEVAARETQRWRRDDAHRESLERLLMNLNYNWLTAWKELR